MHCLLQKRAQTMAKTAVQITDEEMAVYRATARRQEEERRREQAQRTERALVQARRAAALLKERFGARQVVLYGSLARQDFFHQRSDIDLAVRGIETKDFWRAWAALDTLELEFEINLVDAESVSPVLRALLEEEGVEL
jgi:predicted nucleotidyltransferase